jgi:hypothetical protein
MLRINRKIKDRLKKFLQVFFVPQRIADSSFESGSTVSVDFLSWLVWYNRVVESSRDPWEANLGIPKSGSPVGEISIDPRD